MRIDITERTFKFGLEVIKLANKLPKTPVGFRIGGQIVGSGTSIGANVVEAQSASSKKDFINKICISLKEARETKYWLEIIFQSGLIASSDIVLLVKENEEIIKILVTIIKKAKINN